MNDVPSRMVTPQRLGHAFLLAAEHAVAGGSLAKDFRHNAAMRGFNIIHMIQAVVDELDKQGKQKENDNGQLCLDLRRELAL